MDISAINFNFNAVHRAGFSGSADGTDGPVHATLRARRGRTAVAPEAQLHPVNPVYAPEEVLPEQGGTERRVPFTSRKVNVRI